MEKRQFTNFIIHTWDYSTMMMSLNRSPGMSFNRFTPWVTKPDSKGIHIYS